MIFTKDLLVTQKNIRNLDQLLTMIHHVRLGGFFTVDILNQFQSRGKTSPLIEITEFTDDGKQYLHDGHHRASAIVLGGRDFLREDEYRIRKYSYADYCEINLSVNWITPFDPRLEMRKADISEYKTKIQKLLIDGKNSPEQIMTEIGLSKSLYAENRFNIYTLDDFLVNTGLYTVVVE